MNYKTPTWVKIISGISFISLLAFPAFMQRQADRPAEKVDDAAASSYAQELFGFYLDDISDDLGIDFTHESPQLDPRLDHILPTIASMGAAVSVSDFNNDGWNDFYLTTSKYGQSNALYKNLGDGTFEDVAESMGVGNVNIEGTGVSMGSVWADYNNDGFEDLFLYKWGRPMLFQNNEGVSFTDISQQAKLPQWVNSNAAIWFDYDNDGNIDLLLGGYYRETIDLWHLENTLIMPESFEYANNGGRNYLMKNNGDGTFTDVALQLGMTSTRWTLAIGANDFNNDGYQDVYVANDYTVDELFINEGGKGFQEIGKDARIGYAPKSGMNVSIADISNDGRFCVYVSNITEMGILLQGNNLWEPKIENGKLDFVNSAGALGVELGGWSWGSQFGDLNNDGFQDLYLANGYISATKNNSYWYDYSKVTGGNKAIISDALNWPAMEGRSQSGYQQNKVWINSQAGVFADVTDYISNMPPYDSRAVAMVDLGNRGVLDVIVANQNKQVSILRNEQAPGNNWVAFKLEGAESNRSAIGAKVTLVWDNFSQSQVVNGGMGFSSQNQRALHFGIGKAGHIEKAIIQWPSGRERILTTPEINKLHIIKEGNEIS